MVDIYYIDNDNLIELTGLRDAVNSLYLSGATVQLTMVDAATDVEIGGQTWPAAMSYVNGSDGDYRLTLEYDLDVSEGQTLLAKVIADAGEGLRMSLRVPVLALYRAGE